MLGFVQVYLFLGSGDSDVVEGLEDGVLSGGFVIASASIARRSDDIGV